MASAQTWCWFGDRWEAVLITNVPSGLQGDTEAMDQSFSCVRICVRADLPCCTAWPPCSRAGAEGICFPNWDLSSPPDCFCLHNGHGSPTTLPLRVPWGASRHPRRQTGPERNWVSGFSSRPLGLAALALGPGQAGPLLEGSHPDQTLNSPGQMPPWCHPPGATREPARLPKNWDAERAHNEWSRPWAKEVATVGC